MDALAQYLENHRDRFLDDLKAILRIPSISADPKHKGDVRRCAEHLAAHLKAIGMTTAELVETKGHPIVYAEWLGAPGAPTVLLYGHYDVQPVDPIELWKTQPFEPVVEDGKIRARGACDDKGQVYMHCAAVAAHLAVHGRLPVNLKMMIEGEEESGSTSLEPFLTAWKDRLKADVIVVSDTSMLGPDQPALCYALRGMCYTQIEVTGPARDLHSGEFGGAVRNPANALAAILAGLHDADGRCTVPGFYDRVRALTALEKQAIEALPFDEAKFLHETGSPGPFGEKGYSTYERVTSRPTCDVNGMWSGYTGEGAKTVLPSFAAAKVSMRLVPDQDPDEVFAAFAAHVRRLTPAGVTVKVANLHGAQPFITDPSHPLLQAAVRALARSWTKKPALFREGGSIPVMASFQKVLGYPCILMGFGLHDDQVHAPNEKFSLSSFHGGTKSCAYLYEELAKR
ncbi:MAG: dipeptidase [Candidatus Eisenbacteria bacterium]|nr:dipeptidase [Candidatus Eisenbacteria bacterium]